MAVARPAGKVQNCPIVMRKSSGMRPGDARGVTGLDFSEPSDSRFMVSAVAPDIRKTLPRDGFG